MQSRTKTHWTMRYDQEKEKVTSHKKQTSSFQDSKQAKHESIAVLGRDAPPPEDSIIGGDTAPKAQPNRATFSSRQGLRSFAL